jgi:urea transport system permease protein
VISFVRSLASPVRRLHALRALLAIALISAFAMPAFAGPFEDAVAQFSEATFADSEQAVAKLAVTGNPMAATIINALQDGRLYADSDAKKVYLKSVDGKVTDAVTGAAVSVIPDSASKLRLNNKLRRAVEAALGSLTLLSPDPAKRVQAAQTVFKSRDAAALPAIEGALKTETNPAAKKAFAEARAAILLFSPDAAESDKLDAVATIRAKGDQDALALLSDLPSGQPAAVKVAAASAIAGIQHSLAMWSAVQNAWYGLSLGSVLLLAAIGLAITFGVMGVINMAHGEMVMIGAYVTFVVQDIIRTSYPGLFDYSLLIAVPLAFAVAGAIGVLIERTIIRFLYGRPLETLLATWGLSLVLQQAVRTIFGPNNREVGNPSWMSGAFELGQIAITNNRLWILCFTLAVFAILLAMLRYTSLGLEMRAVTQNRRMAASMGIATSRVDALTFGLGSGIAGIAGVALSQIDNVSPNLGQSYIIDSFMVVVFGGVGNLWGTLVGAFTLGIANKFLEPVAGAVLGKIAILVLIILFIQKRPRGLFALKGRAVEA